MAGADDSRPLLGQEDADAEPKQKFACKGADPSHFSHRLIFLFLICFLSFGSYFCYDNPAALQLQFQHDLNLSTSQYMLMYSLYSWPNVVLCFFGGYLMDKILGLRWGAIIFAGLVCAGQVVFAIGASAGSYMIVLIGRFIFGLGGENLAVAQNTYAVSWFKGRELNFVFGLQLSFSRLGSTVNMVSMKDIYDVVGHGNGGHGALGLALWFGAILCGLSLLTAFLAAWLDRRAARILKRDDGKVGEEIKLSDVTTFPPSFWIISLICVAYYVSIFPFIGLAPVYFQTKWLLEESKASLYSSLVYTISAVASPVFGYAVDLTGRNLVWVLTAVSVTLGCHLMLAFTFINPVVPMSIMGVSYSMLASALWPMAALIVPEKYLGTAYGFMQALQNLGLAVIGYVAGFIVDGKGYLWLELFFCMWLSIALMASVLLFFTDMAGGNGLNLPAKVRRALAEKELEAVAEAKLEELREPRPVIKSLNAFQIRNRFMSRMGIQLPPGYAESEGNRYAGPHVIR